MTDRPRECPDCQHDVNRRDFLKTATVAAAAAATAPLWAGAAETSASAPETLVKQLYDGLSETQRKAICFAWDHQDEERGLLRTYVANNWLITEQNVASDFYTKDQQHLVRKIFEGIIQPDWHQRIDKQLQDDAGGFGKHQSIAIFGKPGQDKFEMVITGRHMTLRCDGNSEPHVAFGGPIFYGHAASGFNEKPNHPGNVFWHQALAANKVFEMLDEKQRKVALVDSLPSEEEVGFRAGQWPGLPVTEMSPDQQSLVKEVLTKLVEPYRQSDRDEVQACLKKHGGLEKCSLAFYREGDVGDDKVWDCWRLEGPAFVWYFRGSPHVHVWVNVADDPSVKLNA
jgi:hypothetical protein